MPCQQLSRPNLIVPRKSARAVSREFHVVRWIGIDEIIILDREFGEVLVCERPAPEQFAVGMKIRRVINCLVLTKRDVELATTIEAAQPVEAGAIEIIEELRRFLRALRTRFD